MGSIDRRPNGAYRARYRDPSGREHAKHFKLKRDAARFLEQITADIARHEYVDPDGGRTLFGDRYVIWFETTVNLRASSRARDASYARSLILPTFGPLRLAAIDHDVIQRWVAELIAAGKAAATVHKAHQILSKVMMSAVKAKLLASNPCADTELPRIEREEQRFLTPTEVVLLADRIDPRYRLMVLTAAYTGLRSGELWGLRRRRVDLLQGHVHVAEILTEIDGRTLAFGPPKTAHSVRRVPVPRFVLEELASHVTELAPNDLVFTSPVGEPLRRSLFRRRQWQPAVRAADLSPLRFHDLRHTAIAFWIEVGASPSEIARRAGHASVVTVLDRYGHLLPRDHDTVTDALDVLGRAASADPDRRDGRRHDAAH